MKKNIFFFSLKIVLHEGKVAQEFQDFLFIQDDDISYSVHLRQLFAVQRCHQLPGSRLGGDEMLRQRHGGVSANITGRENGMLNVAEERQAQRC